MKFVDDDDDDDVSRDVSEYGRCCFHVFSSTDVSYLVRVITAWTL